MGDSRLDRRGFYRTCGDPTCPDPYCIIRCPECSGLSTHDDNCNLRHNDNKE